MKNTPVIIIALVFMLGLSLKAVGQGISGVWYNEEKDAKIKVYKTDKDNYEGKIIWLKTPDRDGRPKRDIENKNEALRNRKVMGLKILTGLKKEGDSYKDGEIYDPKSGKTYSCKAGLDGKDKLKIRGYIGISLIGRTTVWTRAASP